MGEPSSRLSSAHRLGTMSELLTESFCERCGTRYTFESGEPATRRPSIKKARVLARGLKHFVLSDDSLETALAEGERDEDRERAALQLEAFHQTFNFCMDCRQYTCRDCWNDAEGRCLSCAPAPGRIESVLAASTPAATQVDGTSRLDALLGPGPVAPPAIEAWPLEPGYTLAAGDVAPTAPDGEVRADDEAESALAPEPEATAADAAPETPLVVEAEAIPAPEIAAGPEAEPAAAAEAVPEWLAVEPEAPVRAPSLEEYLLAASAAQAATAASTESAEAAGPQPAAVEAAPVEPEAEPVAAEATSPEPVAAEVAPPAPIFPPPAGGDVPRSTTRLPGWDMVAPDAGGQQPPPLPHITAKADIRPAPWFTARTNASVWDASTADVISSPGSGVQACVSCGLPLSASAHFCRRCGARQSA